MYEKVDGNGDFIKHTNHGVFPKSGRHTPDSLNLDQKTAIVQNFPHGGDRDVIANVLLAQGKLSPYQQENMKKLKTAISTFLQTDYFKRRSTDVMMIDSLLDILIKIEELMTIYLEDPTNS